MAARSYVELLQRVKELCRYLPSLDGEMRARYCSQMVICSVLVLFRSAFLYAAVVQPALFQGQSASAGALSVLVVFCNGCPFLGIPTRSNLR